MTNAVGFTQKWNTLMKKIWPEEPKEEKPQSTVGKVFEGICKWLYRLRGLFLAIPVLYYALRLATYCMQNLPEQVGLNLLSSGDFSRVVARPMAVYGCLSVTGGCLVLMLLSRKPLFPWVISIFTMVLPLLLLMTNNLDALIRLVNGALQLFG